MGQSELIARREAAVPRALSTVAPIFVDHARGGRVWDVDGNEYLDFCGGIGVQNVGHCHPKVVAAVREQAERLLHTSFHVAMYEPYVELAEQLNERAPTPKPSKTAFFNSGAEACENAVKVARAKTGRPAVLAFERAFHGRTLLGMTMTGKVHPYSAGFGPLAPAVHRLPYEPFFAPTDKSDGEIELACELALDHVFQYSIEPESVACVIVEPVLGEGGFLPIHGAAFRELREACWNHGILLVADEVQSGVGRCGALFACERYQVTPDLLVSAKSLAAGLPLSALVGAAEIMDAVPVRGLGSTYGGNPVACAAALAVLDVIDGEDLCRRAEEIGSRVMEAFQAFTERHHFLKSPRSLGAMCGIEVVRPDTQSADAGIANQLVAAARQEGLLLMTASGNVIRTLMPLVLVDADVDEAMARFGRACETVAFELAQAAPVETG